MSGEGVKLTLPEAPVAFDPFRGGPHGLRNDGAAPQPSVLRAREEPGILQNPEVLRDGGERDVERPGQLGHRGFSPRQSRQNAPPGGIRQGGKGGIQCGVVIVNHVVKYCRAMASLSSANLDPPDRSAPVEAPGRSRAGRGGYAGYGRRGGTRELTARWRACIDTA